MKKVLFFLLVFTFYLPALVFANVNDCKVIYDKAVEFFKNRANWERTWKDLNDEEKQLFIELSWGKTKCQKKELLEEIGIIFPPAIRIGFPDYAEWGKEKMTFVIGISGTVGSNYFMAYLLKKLYGDTVNVRVDHIFIKKINKVENKESKICFVGAGFIPIVASENEALSLQDASLFTGIICPYLGLEKVFYLTRDEALELGAKEVVVKNIDGSLITFYRFGKDKWDAITDRGAKMYEVLRRELIWIEKEFGEKGRGWIKLIL